MTSTTEPAKIGYGAPLGPGVIGEELLRLVRRLPFYKPVERRAQAATVGLWAKWRPVTPPAPALSPALSDNVQRTMNLIMPLADPSATGRAKLLQLFMTNGEVILAGLHSVGCVHSARFDLLGDKLCLFSVYDGDFDGYIRDFIVTVGTFFTDLMGFMKQPPHRPVEHHPDEFIAWVAAHDLVQLPEDITEVCPDLEYLPRCLTVLLHEHPDLQLFSYRQYPSHTAAQIRERLNLGW